MFACHGLHSQLASSPIGHQNCLYAWQATRSGHGSATRLYNLQWLTSCLYACQSLYGLKQFPCAWFIHFSSTLLEFGMNHCDVHHLVYSLHSSFSMCIYLIVYVDDIVIVCNDSNGILQLKVSPSQQFQTKDFSPLTYILGIKVAQFSSSIVICQRKYDLDIFTKTGVFDGHLSNSLMDPYLKLLPS